MPITADALNTALNTAINTAINTGVGEVDVDVAAPLDRLRRLDWRWLLPHPPEVPFERLILCGADDHTMQLALAIGMARRVDRTLTGMADGIAVFAGAEVRMADVLSSLAPGGVVYWETDRTRRGQRHCTARRRAEALHGAGLRIDGRYAIRPHPERAELYLPFERVAWRWFLDTVYAAERPAQWVAEQVARLAVKAGVAATLVPFHAVVAHRPPRAAAPVAERAANAADRRAPLAALVTDSGNRAVSIGFGADGEGAVLVTKLPKRPEFSGRTEHEQDVTQTIRAALGTDAAEVLPRPLGTLTLGEIMASVETAVPGASMFRTSARWGRPMRRRRLDLDRAMDWIATMHRDHRLQDDTWSRARQEQELDGPVRQYIAHFGVTPEETALFEAAIAAANALRDRPLPVVWQHRDYSPSNVHAVDGKGIGSVRVLDWEGAQPGIPVADAWRFAMTWHQAVCGRATSARRAAGIAALIADTGTRRDRRAAHAARRALTRYMETVGVDPAFQPVLVVASAVEHALRRLQQQRDAGVAADAAPATLRGGNVHGELVEQIAQHTGSLFGASSPRSRASRG